ncbi:diguanylate cyclase [Paenibacillus algicola]|uniref:Diguanylate cyclase n=1 Tax=Paenibacillus algicola TaxID=2565926 RepID=A0A4V1G449_9BACL|nr:GGDEF domain-containing protein [Paenibacillus algicola]QCT03454.1 diguanylate cyclase [Paenibacillus algicola]
MDPSAFWSNLPFSGLTTFCIAYASLMVLIMCTLMYLRQRKQAYLLMAAAFFFIMTYEGLNIHLLLSGEPLLHTQDVYRPLQLFSLVLLNLAVLLLYHRMRRLYYGFIFICGTLLLIPVLLQAPPDSFASVLFYDVLEWAVIAGSFLFVAPYIRQRRRYMLGLSGYAVWAGVHGFHSYIDANPDMLPLLDLLSGLPLLFYSVIFLMLFQRMIEQMQSIYRSSITDGLTGLYNRRYFMKHLERYVSQGVKVAAIFCDIDNFKKLNDTQGHARADEVLKQAACILEEELEGRGLAGRYGGEELVALVVSRGSKASLVAEKIRRRIEEETIVTVSVGYSSLRKGVTGEALMKQADQAMYHSKASGKNQVTDFRTLHSRSRTAGGAPLELEG